jgi:hypothetical protein
MSKCGEPAALRVGRRPDVKAYYPGSPQQRTIFQTSGASIRA